MWEEEGKWVTCDMLNKEAQDRRITLDAGGVALRMPRREHRWRWMTDVGNSLLWQSGCALCIKKREKGRI